MDRPTRRVPRVYRPAAESCEGRLLLSTNPIAGLRQAGYFHPIRPNTPVLPFGAPSSVATFVDTTAHVFNGATIFVGFKTFIGPYATLNGSAGFLKIGVNAAILDNAQVLANPQGLSGSTGVVIGNNSVIGVGATVRGPATVGSLLPGAAATFVGPNALIEGATIEPGAWVSALARVGPGVTVPAGYQVKPGKNVTTDAEAADPALGMVQKIPAADITTLNRLLVWNAALAAGYTNLYQGNAATGASPGTLTRGVNNGNLAAVEGSSQEPGTAFEPGPLAPTFPSPRGPQLPGLFQNFRARSTGGVNYFARVRQVAHHLGRGNSIRGDGGQPINIASFPLTGNHVTINAPAGGSVTIGTGLQAGDNSALLAERTANLVVGNNVTVGAGAVVAGSTVGNAVTIGPRALVSGSTVPAGSVIPAGTLLINNKVVGIIQW